MDMDAIPSGAPSLSASVDLADRLTEMSKRGSMERRERSNEQAEPSKYPRIDEPEEGCPTPGQFPLVSCYDDCDRYVEVDMGLLEQFDCKLFANITNDRPYKDINTGKPYWRSYMTRAMLTTFLRSLRHGELSLSKGVSITEAFTTFEYENVPIGIPDGRRADMALVSMPPAGSVFQKRSERVNEIVVRTSERIAHSIARWPRLEACLDAALSGFPVQCTCTATRAWVRFCRKPMMFIDKGDPSIAIARKWPPWAQHTLTAFGIIHLKLVKDKVVTDKARDEAAFKALETAVQGDPLGWYMMNPYDWPRHAMERSTRKEQAVGETFGNMIRQCVLDATTPMSGPRDGAVAQRDPPSEDLTYARACISMAEQLLYESSSPATMFAGHCTDEHGKSPERTQLQKSLQQRGIKVIRWADDDKSGPSKPLLFPSNWAEGHSSGSVHSTMLLDFTDKR